VFDEGDSVNQQDGPEVYSSTLPARSGCGSREFPSLPQTVAGYEKSGKDNDEELEEELDGCVEMKYG